MHTQERPSGSPRAELVGSVASVNVSHGGVPKRPIPGGWVDRLGLEAAACPCYRVIKQEYERLSRYESSI